MTREMREVSDYLDVLMREILARMSVISEQRAVSYERSIVHGGEKAASPQLGEKPLVDYYRDRYARALGPRTRRAVVVDALEALKRARRRDLTRQIISPEPWTFEWKVMIGSDPRPAKHVAAEYRAEAQRAALAMKPKRDWELTSRTVERYREHYGDVCLHLLGVTSGA